MNFSIYVTNVLRPCDLVDLVAIRRAIELERPSNGSHIV